MSAGKRVRDLLDSLENGSVVRDADGVVWRKKAFMWFPDTAIIDPFPLQKSSLALSFLAPITVVCGVSFNRSSGVITKRHEDGSTEIDGHWRTRSKSAKSEVTE